MNANGMIILLDSEQSQGHQNPDQTHMNTTEYMAQTPDKHYTMQTKLTSEHIYS